ncbi:MAG: AzlD domain-containing protein [Chloroflexi bacterium]|nr:AzlD domain-containing protein [Chloroflexota bacterium]
MDQQRVLIGLFGMLLVTYLPRVLPVLYLAGRTLPRAVEVWLRYVPPAVLAAMLLPALVMPNGALDLSLNNLYWLAAIPAFGVAWKTRSLFAPVLTGMALVALARLLGWG